uniref:C-type lectin domain-containing protein n=1 Tax=Pygocentrus nattereri TaxID=42514 RepID=A0A3B4EDW0_PYGNA
IKMITGHQKCFSCKNIMLVLVKLHDEGEDNFIKRLIHAQSNQNQATWLGGYSSKTAYDRWYWTDGSHFDFADWYPGEPNGSGKCLQTNYYGAWDDLVCYNKRPFVCARKAKMVSFVFSALCSWSYKAVVDVPLL